MIFLITLGVIVVEDLLLGVATGFVLSAIKLLYRFTRLDVRLIPTREDGTTVRISGAATFLRLPIFAARLDDVPTEGEVHLLTNRLVYIDEACLGLLQDWTRQREASGQQIVCDRARLQISHEIEWEDEAAETVEARKSA